MFELALIPLLPVASFVVLALAGRRPGARAAYVATAAVAGSFILSLVVFAGVLLKGPQGASFDWVTIGATTIKLGLQADGLSAVMLLVVTIVSLLVHIYSIGYMHGDERYCWYYAVLSLFTAAMLSLVVADNYLQMYMSWELVGLCSYLLIGFWFEKEESYNASKKAFLVTRIGDVGFGIGIIAIFAATGTFAFADVFHAAESWAPWFVTMVTLLLFCGAAGKSAQFPLHVWLPDAMAGPTPVSALIHAATMVAAGVYLVARSFPLFEHSETALGVVAAIGAITAVGAALVAVVQLDIKKVLAYSTISQLGYMMMGLGAGSMVAGMWHLTTHAFFKALLFLGSGSVIHATHTQDIREMGGLAKKMKFTTATFLLGSLALAGIFPLSGFFSKDEILLALFESHNYVVFGAALVGAFLTAFYMTRLCSVVFFGAEKDSHAHESPPVMTAPLVILAAITVVLGFFAHQFSSFLGHEAEPINMTIALGSTAVALLGIYIGYEGYFTKRIPVRKINAKLPMQYLITVLRNKFNLDYLYEEVIVGAFIALCEFFAKFDLGFIDGIVNGVAKLTVGISNIANWIDANIVDGIVNGFAVVVMATGRRLRYVHSGMLQSYAQWMYGALIALILWFIIRMRGGF